MHLVYLGESGNTGLSVNDPHQQHLVHVGLLVHEQQCISMNGEFNALCRDTPQTRLLLPRFLDHVFGA